MVNARNAIKIYTRLLSQGIQVWLSGGWGIDALLEEQTRPHKDLDVIMLLDDVRRLCEIMAFDGYHLKELWSENLWAIDSAQNKVPTAFFLHDSTGRELDAHAIRLDEAGIGIPIWADAEDFIFSKHDLTSLGKINGFTVRCISPKMQVRTHSGYQLPEIHQRDLLLLHNRFGNPGIEIPG